MNDYTKAASTRDIEAVNAAASRLDLRPLSTKVSEAAAIYGVTALVKCTLAAQTAAVGSTLRALLYREVVQQIAAREIGARELALH